MSASTSGELQLREMDAAARLVRLAAGHTLTVTELLAALAHDLLAVSASEAQAPAATADPGDIVRRRLRHVREAAGLMLGAAERIAAAGTEARAGFSRLLTEQLASGCHESMDAFQAHFKVLPTPNVAAVAALRLTLERTERAFAALEDLLAQANAEAAGRVAKRRRAAAKEPSVTPPAIKAPVAELELPATAHP